MQSPSVVAKTWNLSAAIHPSEVDAEFDGPFDPMPAIDQLTRSLT